MNKNTDSIKTVIIVVLLVIVGYFIYTNYANRGVDQSGRIITNTHTQAVGHKLGGACTVTLYNSTTKTWYCGDDINDAGNGTTCQVFNADGSLDYQGVVDHGGPNGGWRCHNTGTAYHPTGTGTGTVNPHIEVMGTSTGSTINNGAKATGGTVLQ